ncbi:MAG: hypothetical protein WGN25_15180 [Candidatus Electrothrix sp. GW3-4]|uniref:hypothetical protein n=1 Tax=Candidatus Electrothrix sp. GW3-4 TaxID=3126740 RepID=UPI0030D342B1
MQKKYCSLWPEYFSCSCFAAAINRSRKRQKKIASTHPDTLMLAVGGEEEQGYDPVMGWGRYGSPLFQSTLLRYNDALEVEYDLATAYSVSEDHLTWQVDIREDAFFPTAHRSPPRMWSIPSTQPRIPADWWI